MECPFCSQWNPPDSRRCCFCGNAHDAAEDGSVSAKPAYMADPMPTTLAREPAHARRPNQPRRVAVGGISLELTSGQWIGLGVFLLFLLTTLSSKCS